MAKHLTIRLRTNDVDFTAKLQFNDIALGGRFTLLSHGDKKISVIKEIRAFTGLGLKEAKDASEETPRVFTDKDLTDAREVGSLQAFADALTAAGGLLDHSEKVETPATARIASEILTIFEAAAKD